MITNAFLNEKPWPDSRLHVNARSVKPLLGTSAMVIRSAALFALILAFESTSLVSAQDIGSVIVSPNTPYVIPVPIPAYQFPYAVLAVDYAYQFPDYQSNEVLTQRNDNNRTGASYVTGINQHSVGSFRKLGEFRVDGVVLAQPLFARGAKVKDISQPVLIIATSNNIVYAFSPSEHRTDPLWQRPLGLPLDSTVEVGAKCKSPELAAWQQWETLRPEQWEKFRPGVPNGLVGIEATPVI